MTVALARALATVKGKQALDIRGCAVLKAFLTLTSSTVSTVNPASKQEVIEEEGEVAKASGYTAICISDADVNGPGKLTSLYKSRKLLAVPEVVNGHQFPSLLVDCGFPVTLIRADMLE